MFRSAFCRSNNRKQLPLNSEYALEIDNLRIVYGKQKEALKNVSLKVQRGRLVSIVGPKDSGKTSLVKCIAGELLPAEGQVRLDATKIAYLKEELELIEHDSVIKNILNVKKQAGFLAKLCFWKHDKSGAAEDIINQLALTEHKDTPVKTLSKELRSKVVLAKALMHNPEIILVDAPGELKSALDLKVLADNVAKINEINALTLLVVAQDFDEAQQISNQIVCLEGGTLIYDSDSFNPWPPRLIH